MGDFNAESDFSEFESTLKQIEDILNNKDPNVEEAAVPKAKTLQDFENLDVDNVRLKVRENRTVINKAPEQEQPKPGVEHTSDQVGFMREVERDANERAQARAKREHEAEVLRNQGNDAFRTENYEKAVLLYSKAVERIKDSPITYNNRALCYLKMRNYKRALDDCNYVLEKLQETNLRAWLYRATAYKHLDDEENFNESVAKALEHNPKRYEYIDKMVAQIKAEV